MAAPTAGAQDVRGYVLEYNGRVVALGDDVPANQANPFVFDCVQDHNLPVLTEILFDVAQFQLGGLYATNVRRA